jgi:putative OPT family oligopeptide transporter
MRELSPLAILIGLLLAVVFGATGAYVGLKLGVVMVASIPAAVISMAVLRGLLKRGTLLEHNIVQTIASSGEALGKAMILVVPALLLAGFEPNLLKLVIWAAVGGLLGILFLVPMRGTLIEREDRRLPYPEGVACAKILQAGDAGGPGARPVFVGLIVGGVYSLLQGLGFWREKAVLEIRSVRTAASLNASPALLGVGYLLGPRIAVTIFAGGVVGWFMILPLIGLCADPALQPIRPEAARLVRDMGPDDLCASYLQYIGLGAVVFGGLLALIRTLPTVLASSGRAIAGTFGRRGVEPARRDVPMLLVLLLLGGLGYAMIRFSDLGLSTAGAVCVLVGAFVFAAVAARLVGLVGGSWSPVAPLALAVVMGTAVLFAVGLKAGAAEARLPVMLVGALVTIAICLAGDLSQDLKTGFLVRATPYKQQIGQMLGVLVSAVVVAAVILMLNRTRGFVPTEATPDPLPALEANLLKRVVDDALAGQLPWELMLIGAMAGLVMELLGVRSLAFGVGLYLPLAVSVPVMVGGLIRAAVDRWRRPAADGEGRGVLSASGLVAGYALAGVVLAAVGGLAAWAWHDPKYETPFDDVPRAVVAEHFQPWLAGTLGFDATYGLGDRADAASAAVSATRPEGEHSVRYANLFWFKLLPVVPFALLSLWLLIAAARRGPPDMPRPVEGPKAPDEPPGPVEIGYKGPLTGEPPARAREWHPPSVRLEEPPAPPSRSWRSDPVAAPIPLSEPEPPPPSEPEAPVVSEPAPPERSEPEPPVEPASEPIPTVEEGPAAVDERPPVEEAPPEPAPPDDPKPPWRVFHTTVRSTDDLPPIDTILRREEPSAPNPEETAQPPVTRTDEPTEDREPEEETEDNRGDESPR